MKYGRTHSTANATSVSPQLFENIVAVIGEYAQSLSSKTFFETDAEIAQGVCGKHFMLRFAADNTARVLLVTLLLVVVTAAIFIAGASLHDPDSCWLLSLGKQIVETGQIPREDAYSYTMGLFPDRKFVLYQWLSEVFFYFSYKAFDLTGLLLLTAAVLTASFVSIPLSFARKIGMPGAFAILGTMLTLLTAFFHFLCRPEIFSYLLLSIQICLTHSLLRHRQLDKIDKNTVTIFGVIGTIWSNLHSGFVMGLLYQGAFVLIVTLANFFAEKKLKAIDKTIILSFFSGVAGSFINPYGAGLWQYLPKLFFTPLNRHIVELQPLSIKDCFDWGFLPFVILSAATLIIVFHALVRRVDRSSCSSVRGQVVFAALIIVCWTIAGFFCRRIIPFAALLMLFEGGYALALLRNHEKKNNPPGSLSFWQMVDQKLVSAFNPNGFKWFLTIAAFAGAGVGFVSFTMPEAVALPQSSKAMQAPFAAINFIALKAPEGRLFNDPQFGDVMIWKLKHLPKLFIDTRFDMYGAQLVDDYQTIYRTENGWESLLDHYQISWIFVRPDAPIASKLQEKGWRTLYKDNAAIILHRRLLPGSGRQNPCGA